MDLSFSAIPQIRISSAFSPSSQCLTSSRREFFGSGNQPWVQGVRYRTILWKLGFHIETPRCATFLDSDCESSILVMSATAAVFIAIPLAILDSEGRKNSKNKFSEIENSDALARGEWHENANFAKNQCTLKQLSHTEAISRKPCNAEGMTVVSRVPAIISSMKDVTLVSKDREMLNYQKALSHIVEKFALFPIINMPSKNGFDESNACLIVGNIKSTIRISPVFDKRGFISGKRGKVLVYSYLQSFRPPPISSLFVISLRKKATVDRKSYYHWAHQHISGRNEVLVTGYNGIYDRSVKENTYYCTEKIDKMSLTCLYGFSEKPLSISLQSKSEYCDTRHSLIRALALQKNSSKYTERRVLVTCKQTSSTKDNGIENGPSSIRDIGKTTMLKKASYLSGSLQPNESVENDSRNLKNFLRIYDCLLRDSRLKDCLDLLEIMEREGLLDMDKVHHTRFLNACKSQKAVKEAFCFCKLIKNPRLSTFNMLLSVCANAQDFDGAFKVMLLMKDAGLKPDCKLYTTLISTCGKCGKIDAMFEVFHEMVNAGVEPNVNTYSALIDGCARAGQVAKAFGVYGIMRSKNVQPDRVVFNALITACGQSGAVDRAFDVLAEMRAEPEPIDPDDVTIGALVKTCIQCGQAKRAREVYKMLRLYNIKGTPDVYTIAVNSCSLNGDLEFAFKIYDDMKQNGVEPDEMFLSAIVDVAGHAQNVDAAFGILKDARNRGILVGNMTYSSLMGACCNAKNWEKALELYEDIKAIELLPTVSTLNALVTALCDGDQLPKCVEVLDEMMELGVLPNIVTYSVLIVACEKKDEAELGFTLFSKAKREGILPNLIMCRCLTGLCLRSYLKACSRGEPIVSFNSGKPQIDSIWTSRAIMVYRETVSSGVIPTIEVFSQVLGCLQFPRDSLLRNRFIEDLGISSDASRCSNISVYLHGFGEYDTRSFSVLEEAASLQVVQRVSFKESPIVLDARKLLTHTVEVYILMILKGLKHRLAAGARLPSITILLPREKTVIESPKGERTVYLATRVGQAVGSLLRRLKLSYQDDESYGKIRINGLTLRRWFKSKLPSTSVSVNSGEMILTSAQLAKGIAEQQRNIRSSNLSL